MKKKLITLAVILAAVSVTGCAKKKPQRVVYQAPAVQNIANTQLGVELMARKYGVTPLVYMQEEAIILAYLQEEARQGRSSNPLVVWHQALSFHMLPSQYIQQEYRVRQMLGQK